MDLRKQFFKTLCELAEDKEIIFLTGDLGWSFFDEFKEKYPEQFINCGIMEQSMVGIASGLAIAGKKPYVYSTAPFLFSRAAEFIRDDVAWNNTNVKLFGVAMSGFLGFTHNIQNNEDLKFFETLPNIKSFAPQTEEELKKIMLENKNNSYYARI